MLLKEFLYMSKLQSFTYNSNTGKSPSIKGCDNFYQISTLPPKLFKKITQILHKTPNKEPGKFKFLIRSIKARLQVGYKYVDIERKLIEFLEQIEENQNPTNTIV